MWAFRKKNRFDNIKPECPQLYYQGNVSTISNKPVSFSNSKRKVFTEVTDAPLPGTYSINMSLKTTNGPVFG